LTYITLRENSTQPPLSLRYQIQGNPRANDAIVCVHELGGSLETFEPLIRSLGNEFCVVTFDQRGSGRSEQPVAPFTVSDLADDLEDLLQELNLNSRVHLVGLAMGSLVALRHVIRHGSRIKSLILFDGTAEIDAGASSYLIGRAKKIRIEGMRAAAQMSLTNAFRGLENMSHTQEFIDYKNHFLANAPNSYAMHSEALAAESFNDEELKTISCPTFVATGETDFIWPPTVGQALANRIPQAIFKTIPKSAHFPPFQAPDTCAGLIKKFITDYR